jgi:hypothetical protein
MLEFKINDQKKGIKNTKADIRYFEKNMGLQQRTFTMILKPEKLQTKMMTFCNGPASMKPCWNLTMN